jgi:hypothetical protein
VGGSIWLPYFAKGYDFKISGIDYSEQGCILVYDLHVVMSNKSLQAAHNQAGLSVSEGRYFLSFHPGVVNIAGHDKRSRGDSLKKLFFYFLYQISKIIWVFERKFFSLPATRNFSPYMVCTARKRLI